MREVVEVPAEPEMIAQAWQTTLAEGGGTAALLVIAVAVLWRWASGLVTRLQAQQEALLTRLIDKQSEAIGRVEFAIVRLDSNFSNAATRLDRHEGRLDDHQRRLTVLETSSESGRRRSGGE